MTRVLHRLTPSLLSLAGPVSASVCSKSSLPLLPCTIADFPFSMAWAEMYMLPAMLVQGFDFEIKGAKAEDFEFEKDNFGIGTKAGVNLMSQVALRGG
jgi:hypothetical protein